MFYKQSQWKIDCFLLNYNYFLAQLHNCTYGLRLWAHHITWYMTKAQLCYHIIQTRAAIQTEVDHTIKNRMESITIYCSHLIVPRLLVGERSTTTDLLLHSGWYTSSYLCSTCLCRQVGRFKNILKQVWGPFRYFSTGCSSKAARWSNGSKLFWASCPKSYKGNCGVGLNQRWRIRGCT